MFRMTLAVLILLCGTKVFFNSKLDRDSNFNVYSYSGSFKYLFCCRSKIQHVDLSEPKY